MSEPEPESDAERRAYEAGYLAAMQHLREIAEAKTSGFGRAEEAAGDFYLLLNGAWNGVAQIVSAFEMAGVKHLCDRRRK